MRAYFSMKYARISDNILQSQNKFLVVENSDVFHVFLIREWRILRRVLHVSDSLGLKW